MSSRVVEQKIHTILESIEKGIAYYSIISILHNLKLSERELQLLAYTNHRGTISAITAKNKFCELFHTSIATVNNLISKLKKKNLLLKQAGKISVVQSYNLDLSKQTVLNITLSNEAS